MPLWLALAGLTTTGAAGATVSTVKFTGELNGVVPLAFVAVAVATCAPFDSAEEGVQLKAPAASVVVVQTITPSTLTLIVTLGLDVPLMTGWLLPVTLLFAGAVITGVSGNGANVATTE